MEAVYLVVYLLSIMICGIKSRSVLELNLLEPEVRGAIIGCRVCWRGTDSTRSCSGYSQNGFYPTIMVPWTSDAAFWVDCQEGKMNQVMDETDMEVVRALRGCNICWRGNDEHRSCSYYSHTSSSPKPTDFVPSNWDVAYWMECERVLARGITNKGAHTSSEVGNTRRLRGCRVCWRGNDHNQSCSGWSHEGERPTAFVPYNWDVMYWAECLRENVSN